MPDVFNRTVELGTPFKADAARLLVRALADPDLVVQRIDFNYKQNITRLWEVGSGKQYYVGGRTEGGFTIQRVVGPRPVNAQFIKDYGDVCKVADSHLTLDFESGGCEGVLESSVKLKGVVLTQVAYAVQAADMTISEQVQGLFTSMEYLGGTGGGAGGGGTLV
jgi:hypothetical protein